jgi:hypothetical protein
MTLGFHDDAFARLHHFWPVLQTIDDHRTYCAARTRWFQSGRSNELVHRRLQLVLDAYRKGGFASGRPEVFTALAEAAVCELPPHGITDEED